MAPFVAADISSLKERGRAGFLQYLLHVAQANAFACFCGSRHLIYAECRAALRESTLASAGKNPPQMTAVTACWPLNAGAESAHDRIPKEIVLPAKAGRTILNK
jgi:hypothetical protein